MSILNQAREYVSNNPAPEQGTTRYLEWASGFVPSFSGDDSEDVTEFARRNAEDIADQVAFTGEDSVTAARRLYAYQILTEEA